MYFVYALSSLERNYIYVGLTNNVDCRISRHNNGGNKTTKAYCPFKLIYSASFKTRLEARNQEKFLKSGCGKEFLKSIDN